MNAMHPERMDLNLFRVFDAIYRERGLTRAAARLHITQPAVSHALARLRALCSDRLFEPQGRQMQPTARARAMAPAVQDALAALGRSVTGPAGFDAATAVHRFTLGMREVQEPFALRALLPVLLQRAPGVSLSLVRLDRDRLDEELRSGVLDAALDVHLPVSRHIGSLRVMSDPLVVVARPGHPRVQGRLTLAAYLREAHVLVSTRRSGLGLEDTALGQRGRQRQIQLRCQHYAPACEAVAASDWLLTLPRSYAAQAQAQLGLQVLPAPCPLPPLEIYLYWDHRLDADAANLWLRQCLEDGLADTPSAPAAPVRAARGAARTIRARST